MEMALRWLQIASVVLAVAAFFWLFRYEPLSPGPTGTAQVLDRWTEQTCIVPALQKPICTSEELQQISNRKRDSKTPIAEIRKLKAAGFSNDEIVSWALKQSD